MTGLTNQLPAASGPLAPSTTIDFLSFPSWQSQASKEAKRSQTLSSPTGGEASHAHKSDKSSQEEDCLHEARFTWRRICVSQDLKRQRCRDEEETRVHGLMEEMGGYPQAVMFAAVAGKENSFPFRALPNPSLPLTIVMSSGGTSTLAFEVVCFSEHILNFLLSVVCFLVALSVSLLRALTAVSGTTTTAQEHRRWKNKPTNPNLQTKITFEEGMHTPHAESSLNPTQH